MKDCEKEINNLLNNCYASYSNFIKQLLEIMKLPYVSSINGAKILIGIWHGYVKNKMSQDRIEWTISRRRTLFDFYVHAFAHDPTLWPYVVVSRTLGFTTV